MNQLAFHGHVGLQFMPRIYCCVSHDTTYPFIVSGVSFSCATPFVMLAPYCYKCAPALNFLSGFTLARKLGG